LVGGGMLLLLLLLLLLLVLLLLLGEIVASDYVVCGSSRLLGLLILRRSCRLVDHLLLLVEHQLLVILKHQGLKGKGD